MPFAAESIEWEVSAANTELMNCDIPFPVGDKLKI